MDANAIAIGFAAPLSGPQALVGAPMCRAVALAVERFNAGRVGARPVRLVAVDDHAEAAGAHAAAAALIGMLDVVGVVGHKNSDCCAATGDAYAAAGLPHITPSATNSALSARRWPTFFRICADNERQAAMACEAMVALGIRAAGVVHDTTAYGQPLAESVIARLPALGIAVSSVLALPVGAGDAVVAEIASGLRASRIDAVYAGLTEVEGALLVRALRAGGSAIPLFGAEGGRTAAFRQLAGAAAEGCYHTYAGVDLDTAAEAAAVEFVQEYERRYGAPPSGFAAECYDAAGLLLRAIGASARPDRAAVLDALRRLPAYEGVTGIIAFDAQGERRSAAVSLWQVRNGHMEIVVPAQLHRGERP